MVTAHLELKSIFTGPLAPVSFWAKSQLKRIIGLEPRFAIVNDTGLCISGVCWARGQITRVWKFLSKIV